MKTKFSSYLRIFRRIYKARYRVSRVVAHCTGRLLPIVSLLDTFKKLIDVDVPIISEALQSHDSRDPQHVETITVLEDMSALWLRRKDFELQYGRMQQTNPPFKHQSKKCSGCILASMTCNVDALIALGGCFIGRVRTGKWRNSKRIIWIEEWIRGSFQGDETEQAVRKMWELGIGLRRLRKTMAHDDHERPYIDHYVRKARRAEALARRRPPRSSWQHDHVAFVKEALSRIDEESTDSSIESEPNMNPHEHSLAFQIRRRSGPGRLLTPKHASKQSSSAPEGITSTTPKTPQSWSTKLCILQQIVAVGASLLL